MHPPVIFFAGGMAVKTRIITALVLLPILVVILLAGTPVVAAAVLAVAIMGLYEFFKATGVAKHRLLCAAGYVAAAAVALRGYIPSEAYLPLFYIFMLTVFCIMLKCHASLDVKACGTVVFGLIYIPFFLSTLVDIRSLENGKFLLWLVFIGAFLTDTCAYFCGVFLGKHKLCRNVSPKKTVEGSLGGVLGCAAACLAYGLLLERIGGLAVSYPRLFILGLLMAVVSQVGDLSASVIKRSFGIKDYGNIFPGHGGILDRLDSVIMIAPMVLLYVELFGLFA